MISHEKILVVDDDPMILEMICDGLEQFNVHPFPAKNPVTALNYAENNPVTTALLDYDLGVPGMNGIKLGQEIKNISSETSVIIMTGYHNIKIAIEATRNFYFDHMIKPFRIDQVISQIERSRREYTLRADNKKLMEAIRNLREEVDNLKSQLKSMGPVPRFPQGVKIEQNSYQQVNSGRASKMYERQKNHRFDSDDSSDPKK